MLDRPVRNLKRKDKKEFDDEVSNDTLLCKQVDKEEVDGCTRLPLKDAEVLYAERFVENECANIWLQRLKNLETWYHPTLRVYGKSVVQSRAIAVYSNDSNMSIKYSGTDVKMNYEYPAILTEIQEYVEEKLKCRFNYCMLNKYEDGSIYIGKHNDTLDNRVIATLSLGAPRTFVMSHKYKKSPNATRTKRRKTENENETGSSDKGKNVDADGDNSLKYNERILLPNGSLLVMQGETQQFWKHEIPKEPKIKECRISLTFRQLQTK